MTNETVMTLNDAQRHYLRAAIACLLSVQGQAAERIVAGGSFDYGRRSICQELRDDAMAMATTDYGNVPPLDHQEGAELADLLSGCTIQLRQPLADDTVQVEQEAWVVPCKITIAGARTADEAAVIADTFLGLAMVDSTVNADGMAIDFEIGADEVLAQPIAVAMNLEPSGTPV